MSNTESAKLMKLISFECDVDDDWDLSDELTSEGPVTPNAVRKAVSHVNMNKTPLGMTTFKTVKDQNKKLKTVDLNKSCGLQNKELNLKLYESQKIKILDFESKCRRESSSLKSDISFLLRQMIKNKQEKQIEVFNCESIEEIQIEELISMNDVECADVFAPRI